MLYVIKNMDTQKYVAASGSEHSYTKRLEEAKTFSTYGAAQTDACRNEYIVDVMKLLRKPEET